MKKLAIVCLALAATVSFNKSTYAEPSFGHLTLTTDSGVTLFISVLGGTATASVPFDMSGTIFVMVDDSLGFGLVNDSTGLLLGNSDISLSDQLVDIPVGFLGGVLAEINGAKINTLTSNGYIPISSTNATNPFTYTFDPGGGSPTQVAVDEGTFTYQGTGPFGGTLGLNLIDFANDPLAADIPASGQVGMLTQNAVVSDGLVYATVSIPITFADTLITDPVTVDVDLSGLIVATGFLIVPEPSTIVLLSIALLGLVPVWRRIRK